MSINALQGLSEASIDSFRNLSDKTHGNNTNPTHSFENLLSSQDYKSERSAADIAHNNGELNDRDYNTVINNIRSNASSDETASDILPGE